MTKKEELIEQRNKLAALVNQLVALPERNEQQDAEYDDAVAEFDRLTKAITQFDAANRINATLAAPASTTIQPTAVAQSTSVSVGRRSASPGSFTRTREERFDAFMAALPYNDPNRLAAAGGDIYQEAQGADGGLVLPVDKRALQPLLAPPDLVHGRCDIIYSSSNATTVPTDEDPDWSSSDAAADVAEGNALTEQKSAFTSVDLTLAKSGVLVRITREMLDDASGIGTYIQNKLARKLAWKLHSKAITAFRTATSRVTVDKTGSAGAASAPDFANVQAMWGKMLTEHRQNAIWLANPSLEATFQGYYITGASGGVFPVYMPGLQNAPYATLKGRPVLYLEGLPAVGTEGDLMLVDPSTFFLCLKTQGPRIEESIHAEFKYDVVQYRAYIRSVVTSKFSAQITRADSTKAGNVITLQTRS